MCLCKGLKVLRSANRTEPGVKLREITGENLFMKPKRRGQAPGKTRPSGAQRWTENVRETRDCSETRREATTQQSDGRAGRAEAGSCEQGRQEPGCDRELHSDPAPPCPSTSASAANVPCIFERRKFPSVWPSPSQSHSH